MEFTDVERRVWRSLAMSDLYSFSRWMFVNRRGYTWQRAAHHQTICDALTRVFNGECKRLIINIPPRYSKTELIKNFISWSLGHAPDSEFIYTSYSGRLASASSWDVRSLVQEPEYCATFPNVKLRDDSQAKDEWRTTAGGIMYAVGAGGSITGYGAGKHRPGFGGALIVDDPLKADEARSDVIRQNGIDWFQGTLESRKNSPETTPIIIIMQRLHENDLSGWLLAGGNGEKWEHVCLPALQSDDTALWPEKHSVEELRRMESAAPYTFSGQYQQRPSPAEGGIFKPDQIPTIDAMPAGYVDWVRGWDLASTTDGDWTAGVKIGRMADGRFIIADAVRVRVGPDERDAAILNTASSDGKRVRISIPQDPGQAGKTQVLYLTRALAGYPVTSSPESGDKVTRAEPVAAQINIGNVMMMRGEWNKAFIGELRMFPNGVNDDQIDGLSRAFSHLINRSPMRISDEAMARSQQLTRT
jgi:predicted phage terminase large subunit-like protein